MMEKGQFFICAEDLNWKKMFLLIALPITLTLSVWTLMMITENYLRISRKNFKSLTGDGELKLIKYDRVYLKIYFNDKGEMAPKFWEVFCEDGKEYKKPVLDKEALLGKYVEGEVVFSLQIFLLANPKVLFVSQRNSCEGNNRRRKELFWKIPCLEKKLKLPNDNAFFVFQRNPLKYIFFCFS